MLVGGLRLRQQARLLWVGNSSACSAPLGDAPLPAARPLRAPLVHAQFLGRTGGTTGNAIRAIDYFTDLKLRHGLNLVATSNSW